MLLTVFIVIVVLALALYGIRLLPIDGNLSLILQAAMVVIAIIYIANAAGLA